MATFGFIIMASQTGGVFHFVKPLKLRARLCIRSALALAIILTKSNTKTFSHTHHIPSPLQFPSCSIVSHSPPLIPLRSVKACLEISAIRNVWAAAAARLCNEKMALVWSRTAMVPSGWAESRPFPPPVWTQSAMLVRSERLQTIAVVFYLSFLLFSVVVVGFSSFQTWEMLGQVKTDGFGGCKLLSPAPVVRVALDIESPRKGSIVSRQLHVRDRIDKNVAGGLSCLRTHSGLCARPAALQLQQLINWVLVEDLHCRDTVQ